MSDIMCFVILFLSFLCFSSFTRLELVLLLADVKDLEGLLGGLEAREGHGTESRAWEMLA